MWRWRVLVEYLFVKQFWLKIPVGWLHCSAWSRYVWRHSRICLQSETLHNLPGIQCRENSSLWFCPCPCPCPVFCPLFLPCYFCPCPVFCPLTWVHINSQRLQHWHVWKAVPSVERLPGKHQEGVGSFREDNDFADVTLACEDGQQVQAHKVILADSVSFPEAAVGTSTH